MATVKTLTPAEKLPSLSTRMTRASRMARRKAKEEVLEALPHSPVATAPSVGSRKRPGSCKIARDPDHLLLTTCGLLTPPTASSLLLRTCKAVGNALPRAAS
eukprot:scaffold45812_cov36-Phaeocystis_antarctica.AAC.1